MNQQVIFNDNKKPNNSLFDRHNLIFNEFHKSTLLESFRSKPSITKEDRKQTLNFNDHLMKQRDGLGHNFTNNNINNFSQNYTNNCSLLDGEKKEKPKLVGVVNIDNSLPPNIYHNFSVSDRDINNSKNQTIFDYNARNFRVNYPFKK